MKTNPSPASWFEALLPQRAEPAMQENRAASVAGRLRLGLVLSVSSLLAGCFGSLLCPAEKTWSLYIRAPDQQTTHDCGSPTRGVAKAHWGGAKEGFSCSFSGKDVVPQGPFKLKWLVKSGQAYSTEIPMGALLEKRELRGVRVDVQVSAGGVEVFFYESNGSSRVDYNTEACFPAYNKRTLIYAKGIDTIVKEQRTEGLPR